MCWNLYRNILNVLLQNLIGLEHFEICALKLIKILISRKLIDQLNYNFVFSLFLLRRIHSRKIIKL